LEHIVKFIVLFAILDYASFRFSDESICKLSGDYSFGGVDVNDEYVESGIGIFTE